MTTPDDITAPSQRAQSGLRTTKVYAVNRGLGAWRHKVSTERESRDVYIVQQGNNWFFVEAESGVRVEDPGWPSERLRSLELEGDYDFRLIYPTWYEDLDWSCGL